MRFCVQLSGADFSSLVIDTNIKYTNNNKKKTIFSISFVVVETVIVFY